MSSDTDTTICPECETEQPTTAPFCQNCGYRMRSPKTLQEPMAALSFADSDAGDDTNNSNEADSASKRRGSRPERTQRAQQDSSSDSDDHRPTRKMVSPLDSGDDPEHDSPEPTKKPDSAAKPAAPALQKSPETIVEGMEALSVDSDPGPDQSKKAEPGGDEQTSDADESSPPAPTTARIPIDDQRYKIRWIVGGALVACIIIVGGLSWLHLERQAAADSTDGGVGVESEIIDIDAGPFRRGLSEDAEAFILEFCYRYHDDPHVDCDRETLLSGEFPEQTVEMPAYSIDATPVRTADYRRCVDDGSCEAIDYANCDVWTPRGLQPGLRVPDILRRDERPVVCVDRRRADDYCDYSGGSLPTHNQWEKAARGDNTPLFPWGDRWMPDRANWGERDVMRSSVAGELDGYAWTSPPGAFPEGKSPYGAHDMAGNVSEWVRGSDPLIGYVRGGSFVSNPFELRTTVQKQVGAQELRTDIGFRCTYRDE